jgi:phosphoglycolate phosphatase
VKDSLVIFDLDGTLVDTAPDLITALNHTIVAEGLTAVGYEDITHLVGQGAKMMIQRAYHLQGQTLDEDAVEPLLARFIAFYLSEMPGDSKPYPGVIAAMERLVAAGCKLAVCTNKIEQLALPLVQKLGLSEHFTVITGGDTFEMRKPHAGHILGTIARAGGDPQKSVMIGDSINDILAARNAGIPSVAVSFGYSDVPVEQLQASTIIQSFDQLTPALIADLLDKAAAKVA